MDGNGLVLCTHTPTGPVRVGPVIEVGDDSLCTLVMDVGLEMIDIVPLTLSLEALMGLGLDMGHGIHELMSRAVEIRDMGHAIPVSKFRDEKGGVWPVGKVVSSINVHGQFASDFARDIVDNFEWHMDLVVDDTGRDGWDVLTEAADGHS